MRIVSLAIVAFAAFAPSLAHATSEMDQTAIIAEINEELAGTGWMVGEIEITGTSRMERSQERLVVQEFRATARALQTFYRQSHLEEGYVFVDPVLPPGSPFYLRGEAVDYSSPGTTEQRVQLHNLRDMVRAGHRLEHFEQPDRTVVILGTPEEAQVRAILDAARAAAEAEQQAEFARIAAYYEGEWISLGRCGTIIFEHRFQIEPAEGGHFTGDVTYRTIRPHSRFEFGSYAFNARHDAERNRLVIEHSRWTEQPQDHRAVTITLNVQDYGDRVIMTGDSQNVLGSAASGNCNYRLQRPEAHEAAREAVRPPVRALLERLVPGEWITGSQTGPGRDGRTGWPVRVRVDSFTEDYITATAEVTAFHTISQRVLGAMEISFTVYLVHGLRGAELEFGRPPAVVNTRDVLDLYSHTRGCPYWSVSLDAESGLLTASHGAPNTCIAFRLPLLPASGGLGLSEK